MHAGATEEVSSVLLRLVDYLKSRGITAVLSMLLHGGDAKELEHTSLALSSMVDTWVLLRDIEVGGERNRGIYVLKSRGMAHSNQIREFRLTPRGIVLREAYLGPEGVLTGSARVAQESRDRAAESAREWELEIRRLEIERKQKAIEAQIAVLHAESEAEGARLRRLLNEESSRLDAVREVRDEMAVSRKAEAKPESEGANGGGRAK